MVRHVLGARRDALALAAGALLLIVCSLMRVAGQPLVDHVPMIAAILTLLVFLIPGSLTGLIAPRSFLCNGAILGMIGAAFVTLQSIQFQPPNWSSLLVYQAAAVFACITVPSCIVGTLGGRFVRERW
jgi:hypothetical protein